MVSKKRTNMIQKLTKKQYNILVTLELFSEEYSRSYGCITIDSKTYKFSWQSTLIDPQIEFFKPNIVGIAIDQHFCLLNSKNGEFKTFRLFTPFLFMKTFEKELFIVCETEIMLLNPFLLEQDREYSFDEIIKDITVRDQFLTVFFIDDSETRINLNDENSIYITH